MTDPFVSEVADKVARQQPLSVEEIQRWHDWFQVASGQLAGLFNRTTAGEIDVLSDVTPNLGTMYKGEFIAVKEGALSLTPTSLDFTGSFMSAYGYEFNGVNYKVGSVKDGVLGFGFNEDGDAVAGAGTIILNEVGFLINSVGVYLELNNTTAGVGEIGAIQTIPNIGRSDISFRSNQQLTVPDNGFESGGSDWTYTGSAVRSSTQAKAGTYSGFLTALDDTITSANYIAVSNLGALLDFWVYRTGTPSNLKCEILCYGPGPGYSPLGTANFLTTIFTTGAVWTRFMLVGTYPTNTENVKIRFTNLNSSRNIWVDEISLYDGYGFQYGAYNTLGGMALQGGVSIPTTGKIFFPGVSSNNTALEISVSEDSSLDPSSSTSITTTVDGAGGFTNKALYITAYAGTSNPPSKFSQFILYADGLGQDQILLNSGGDGTVGSTGDVDTYIGSNSENYSLFVSGANGRVGIKNNSPSVPLDVTGSGKFSGPLTVTDTTDSSSISTGALIVSGGAGIAKQLTVGEDLIVTGSQSAPFDIRSTNAGGFTNTFRSTPAANSATNDVTNFSFNAKNSAGNEYQSAIFRHVVTSPTSGSEGSRFQFMTKIAGAALSVRLSIDSDLTLADGMNIVMGTGTGTKIGTGATQKLSFWNAPPIVRPTLNSLATYSVTNLTIDRAFDANTAVLAEIADVLGTLCQDFDDLKAKIITTGLLG